MRATCRRVCASLLALALPFAGHAASLQVEPTSVRLNARAPAALLTLRNHENRSLNVQVRAYEWTQEDGEDRLLPTDALRVSSPIVEVSPAGEQVIRIFPTQVAPEASATNERAFRLIIDELPDRDSRGVQLVLRYSIPVFIDAGYATRADLHFWIEHADGAAFLAGENIGQASAQLSNVALVARGERRLQLAEGLFGYLLAGRQRRWPLSEVDEVALAARLSVHVDGQERNFELESR